jgi:thioredoxin-like negative regulator of GroEL
MGLGDNALSSGDLAEAESRYRRALAVEPQSARARIGLARVYVKLRRDDEASALLREVLASGQGPERADALMLQAEVDERQGRVAEARRALTDAVTLDDDNYRAHQRLADLTGSAGRSEAPDDDEALRQAEAHPYDPAALVAGARVRAARGDRQGAVEWLENALWLADLDRESSRRAGRLLTRLDPKWERRTVVPVHVYADESVRRERGWKVRMRLVWRSASTSLDSLLHVAFVPVSINSFQSSRAGADLDSITEAFRASAGTPPSYGLLSVMTERFPQRRRGGYQLGVAEFLGRELVVRLDPGEIVSRTLIHEVFHIYGGAHVAPGIESLMNPSGDTLRVDLGNVLIGSLTRHRRFGPGGIQANVLPYVDVDELIGAYLEMLRVNLGLRDRRVEEARAQTSRYVAAALAREALAMDPHLGDVAHVTGVLMLESGDPGPASELFGMSARFYGPTSPRGRKMFELAERTAELAAGAD